MVNETLNPETHAWMRSAEINKLFAAFPEGELRFVGGCVRNSLMGREIGDVDVATTLEPKDVVTALKAAGIKSVPTGIAHGTVTAVVNGEPYEITSLRKDVETDGRRAVVAFTQDWAEDAQRRDLTMNALYADYDGTLYDPCGEGLSDLKARRFRFVGDASARVTEDYLRILRFFRFIAWYGETNADGKAHIDAEALTACRENREGLKGLSVERIWSEAKKLLAAPNPSRAVRIMLTNEILDAVLPEASNAEGLDLMVALEDRAKLPADSLLRMMAMAAREPIAIAGLCKRLKLSKAEKTRLMAWVMDSTPLDANASEREKKIAIYKAGGRALADRAYVRAAGEDDPIAAARWISYAELALGWTPPEFPLTGKDLIAAGSAPGEAMGKKLDALKALWIKSGFTADKPKLLMALTLLGR
ncbi:MAG: CCA tRNA nucleotidyltransferase [Maricaulaceae bacterium]